MTLPIFSIIIPTIGRISALKHTLACLRQQEYSEYEVIVVDQTNDNEHLLWRADNSVAAREFRYLRQTEPNASAARNLGIRTARGDVLIFLDDDVDIPRRDFLAQHAKNYCDPEVAGVVGQILGADRRVRFDRHPWSLRPRVGWLYFPRNFGHRVWVESGGSGNCSVRRAVAVKVRGMDENFEKGAFREEADFFHRCVRAGFRFVFEPEASLIHLNEPIGGSRSWGSDRGLVPFHHAIGEMYFILKNVQWPDHLDHFGLAIRRQIVNDANMRRPLNLIVAGVQLIRAIIAARRLLQRGPRYLSSEPSAEVENGVRSCS
jgi:glycosyltransferase involved in cell wall biosynthesis